jgi:hypothetical protein
MVAILSFLLLLLSALFCSNFSSGLGTGGMQDTPLRLHVKEDEFLPRFEAIYPPEEEEPQNRELRHAIIQNRMQKERRWIHRPFVVVDDKTSYCNDNERTVWPLRV